MPIPQDLSTTVENPTGKGFPSMSAARSRAAGGTRQDDSTRFFHIARRYTGLDALSVVKRFGQRRSPPRILTARPAVAGRSPRRGSSDDGQGQADVSAEQPPPLQGARLPPPDAHASRQGHPRRAAAEGPLAAHRLTSQIGAPMRSRDVRRVLDEGRPLHGKRVVVFLAPGTGAAASVAGRKVGSAVERNR